jgi:cytochrome c-type protein NapB
MKTWITGKMATPLMGLAILAITAVAGSGALAQDMPVQSLRGLTAIDQDTKAAEPDKQFTGKLFERNYRQQPPLIPHKISSYQIDLKANQCMGCHDWPQNTAAGAPKISETHYVDRNGVKLNHVSTGRWFCNQCHVPQAEARELVPNTFKSAVELR